jgi:hypothetical protein
MSTLSRRDQMAVSSAALSSAPWRTAALTGAVVGAGDLGLSLIGGHIGLAMLSGPVSLGALVFFTVAAVGSLFGQHRSRALAWARGNPWKFALAPALACAAVVLPVALVLGGSGIFSAVFSAFWHGIVVFGLTGAAGSLRRRPAAE